MNSNNFLLCSSYFMSQVIWQLLQTPFQLLKCETTIISLTSSSSSSLLEGCSFFALLSLGVFSHYDFNFFFIHLTSLVPFSSHSLYFLHNLCLFFFFYFCRTYHRHLKHRTSKTHAFCHQTHSLCVNFG